MIFSDVKTHDNGDKEYTYIVPGYNSNNISLYLENTNVMLLNKIINNFIKILTIPLTHVVKKATLADGIMSIVVGTREREKINLNVEYPMNIAAPSSLDHPQLLNEDSDF